MALFLNAQEVELLAALNLHQVRYIVVGGHAVQHHGYLRPAKDLDIWLEPSEENALKAAHALASARAPLTPDQAVRMQKPKLQMRIGGHTEILTSMDGLEFAIAMARSVSTSEQGIPCQVLSLDDLLLNKRLVGRTSDLEDVASLEGIPE